MSEFVCLDAGPGAVAPLTGDAAAGGDGGEAAENFLPLDDDNNMDVDQEPVEHIDRQQVSELSPVHIHLHSLLNVRVCLMCVSTRCVQVQLGLEDSWLQCVSIRLNEL